MRIFCSTRWAIRASVGYIPIVFLTGLFLAPFAWIVSISLKTRSQIFSENPLVLWRPTLENYLAVLNQESFVSSLTTSLFVSLTSAFLSLALGVPAGYAAARLPYKRSLLLLSALLLMRMIPPIAVLVPMFLIFAEIGLSSTYARLAIVYTTFGAPLVAWAIYPAVRDVPIELEESAIIDGASSAVILLRIVLPLIKPALFASIVLALLMAWNDFLFAVVLSNDGVQTMPVMMSAYSGDTGIEWGLMSAASVLVVAPLILLLFAAQVVLGSSLLKDDR